MTSTVKSQVPVVLLPQASSCQHAFQWMEFDVIYILKSSTRSSETSLHVYLKNPSVNASCCVWMYIRIHKCVFSCRIVSSIHSNTTASLNVRSPTTTWTDFEVTCKSTITPLKHFFTLCFSIQWGHLVRIKATFILPVHSNARAPLEMYFCSM